MHTYAHICIHTYFFVLGTSQVLFVESVDSLLVMARARGPAPEVREVSAGFPMRYLEKQVQIIYPSFTHHLPIIYPSFAYHSPYPILERRSTWTWAAMLPRRRHVHGAWWVRGLSFGHG